MTVLGDPLVSSGMYALSLSPSPSLSLSLSPAPGRQPQKPLQLKRMMKLKDQEVVSSACGSHATAMVTKDGKVFMFGSLEEEVTDKSSGECNRGSEEALVDTCIG